MTTPGEPFGRDEVCGPRSRRQNDRDPETGAQQSDPWEEQAPPPLRPTGLRHLATAGAIGVAGAAGTVFFGWLRTKGLAVALGPGGLGVYGQLWTFVLYAGQVASLGIGVGATALVATEHQRGDRETLGLTGSLTFLIPTVAGALGLLLTLAAAPFLAPLLLDEADVFLLVIAALSIPFVAVQAPLQHLIQGMEDVVGQNVAYLVYGAAFTVFAVAGAFLWGVEGAVIGLTLGNVVLAAIYLVRSQDLLHRAGTRLRTGASGLKASLRSPTGRALLRIGAGSLAISIVFGIADLTVRTVLLRESGANVAGYWYALMLISVQFVGLMAGAFSYLTVPLAARHDERDDRESVRQVLNDSVRLVCLTALPLLVLICALRDPVVDLLFTSEFDPVADQLPLQLSGDLLRSLAWTLGVALIPLGYVFAWVVLGIGTSLLFGIAGGLLAASHGLDGAVESWVLVWGVTLVATAMILVRSGYWRPTLPTTAGVLVAAAGLAAATVAPGPPGVAASFACFAVIVAVTTTASERAGALRALRGLRGG